MLSKEYAHALFELSTDIDTIKNNFDGLMEIIRLNPDFKKILESPVIKKDDKKEIIKNSFVNMDELFISFCYVIIDNDRFNIIDGIYNAFNQFVIEAKNIFVINAYTSKPLTSMEEKELISNLQNRFKGNLKINNIIDNNALGGIRLEHNGESIDQTLKAQMHNLKALL